SHAETAASGGRVGWRAQIHESARLVGPVIVQDGASIAANATVIGPALIGAAATIGANALVVQCVVQPETDIAERAVVRQRLVSNAPDADASPSICYDPSRIPAIRTELREEPAKRGIYPTIKLAVESTISALALAVISPLLAIIAALIKLESRGPVFFADRREARGGRNFRCLKFRTMVQGADAM